MKKIIIVIFAVTLLLPIHLADAQNFNFAEKAKQKSVEVSINADGDVNVRHVVAKSHIAKQVDLIAGTRSNITVTGIDGEDAQHAMVSGDLGVLILPSDIDTLIQYDLADVLEQNGVLWKWDFLYLESTIFNFPESIDMVFVTGQPVALEGRKAINCHGCQMILEYFEETDVQVEYATLNQRQFEIPIISPAPIESFEFDQRRQSMSFEATQERQLIMVIMPLDLISVPHQVYYGDQKVLYQSYVKNDTHASINMRVDNAEPVTIIKASGDNIPPIKPNNAPPIKPNNAPPIKPNNSTGPNTDTPITNETTDNVEFYLFLLPILGAILAIILLYKKRIIHR